MSFGIHTDRYPDTLYRKFQTASLIHNAFSEALNLAHIPKIRVFMAPYEQTLRLGRLFGGKAATLYSVSSDTLLSLLCLTDFVAHSRDSKG